MTNLTIRTCFYQLPRPMTVFMNRLRGLIGHRAFVQVSDETLAGLASYDRVVIAESARMLFGIYSWEIGGCCLTSRMIQTWMWSRLFHRQSGFTDRPLGSITRQLAATEKRNSTSAQTGFITTVAGHWLIFSKVVRVPSSSLATVPSEARKNVFREDDVILRMDAKEWRAKRHLRRFLRVGKSRLRSTVVLGAHSTKLWIE